MLEIYLRAVTETDIALFHAHQMEREAIRMAAFTPAQPLDAAAFAARWTRLRANPDVVARTIVAGGEVAGSIARFVDEGKTEVTYWLGRSFWGQGIATRALALFLGETTARPLYARVATDNQPSLRVLQKCGFVVYGTARGYANARAMEIDESLLRLD